jgi:hypothetical protein
MRVNDLITRRCSPRDAATVYDQLVRDRASLMGMVFDWAGLD